MTAPISRRNFLNTLLVGGTAALTSCDNSVDTKQKPAGTPQAAYDAEKDPKNLFNVLKHPDFQGVRMLDGTPMNAEALKQKLKGKYVTISFGWNGCSSYCPRINKSLAATGDIAPNDVVSLVVSVAPRDDGADQQLRDSFLKSIKDQGVKHDVVPLFPNTGQQAIDIQKNAMGHVIRKDDNLQHTATITLFDPSGKELSRKMGVVDDPNIILKDWKRMITPQPHQGVAR